MVGPEGRGQHTSRGEGAGTGRGPVGGWAGLWWINVGRGGGAVEWNRADEQRLCSCKREAQRSPCGARVPPR